jgi:hypothetical protein
MGHLLPGRTPRIFQVLGAFNCVASLEPVRTPQLEHVGFVKAGTAARAAVLLSLTTWALDAHGQQAIAYNQQTYTSQTASCHWLWNEAGVGDLLYSDDIATAWQSEIAPWGFSRNVVRTDFSAETEDLIDADVHPLGLGSDNEYDDGIDRFDIALVLAVGHATDSSGVDFTNIGFVDTEIGGAPWEDISACYAESSTEMFFNDLHGILKQAFFFSDQSANHETWDEGGLSALDSAGFALLAGFHGPKTERSSDQGDMESYVATSRTSGVGTHWISEFFQDPLGSNNDDCPTVVIYASSTSVALNYHQNAGLDDFLSEGTHSMTMYVHPSVCDPPGTWEAPFQ